MVPAAEQGSCRGSPVRNGLSEMVVSPMVPGAGGRRRAGEGWTEDTILQGPNRERQAAFCFLKEAYSLGGDAYLYEIQSLSPVQMISLMTGVKLLKAGI